MQPERLRFVLGSLLALGCAGACGAESLGGAPVCEASAAAVVPCATGSCLLVGDNELRQHLVSVPIEGNRLDVSARRLVSIEALLTGARDRELSDIEALVQRRDGRVIVFGSHSRNKDCERRANRRRFLGLSWQDGRPTSAAPGLVSLPARADLSRAFGSAPTGLLGEAKAAVARAEREADAGRCEHAFEIEAAIEVPGESGEELWLGLRGPLIRGQALWLRLTGDASALRFDAARTIDLDGRGIRGASAADDFVYGLSPRTGSDEFRLWRFPVSALRSEAPIAAEDVASVPRGSEGIAIAAGHAFVVQDGRLDGGGCAEEAHYTSVPLPP